MNNQNPNKRRGNFTTQQQRKRQKLNQFQQRGRGTMRGRGRGRGFRLTHKGIRGRGPNRGNMRGRSNRGRGRGRGINTNLSQPQPSTNNRGRGKTRTHNNINQSQPQSQPNITITRRVSNPQTTPPSIPSTQSSNDKLRASLRAQLFASQKSKKDNIISGTLTSEQIEQQLKLKQIKKANTAPAAAAAPINNAKTLRALALQSLNKNQTQTQIQNQNQKQSTAEIANQKRKQMLRMKNKMNNKAIKPQSQNNLNPNASTFKPNIPPTNITINNQPSHPNISPRKLTNYRKGPKSMNNISFTTTTFDPTNNVVKTVISTNNINTNTNTNKKPLPKIPPLPNIPPSIPTTATVSITPKPKPKPKPKPIKTPIVPKTVPIISKQNNILANDALNWSCGICTYDNKNNKTLVCSMCAKTNPSKKQIPTRKKVSQSNISQSKPIKHISNIKPIQTQTIATPIQSNNKPIQSNICNVIKPKPKPLKPMTFIPSIKPKIIPQKQLKPIVIPISKPNVCKPLPVKINTEEIWNQRDKAIQERDTTNIQTHKSIQKHIVNTVKKHVNIIKKPVNIVKKPINMVKKPVNMIKKPVNIIKKAVVSSPQKIVIPTPITRNEIQKQKIVVPKVVKPIVNITQNMNVSKPQAVAVVKKHIMKKPMQKPIVKVVKAVSPLPVLSDCWKLDMKQKINVESLELFIKETDTFINGMDIDLKNECKQVGIEYVNIYDMDKNNGIMYDIVEDFEWTKKICEKNNIEWRENLDMNTFSNIVKQCDEW